MASYDPKKKGPRYKREASQPSIQETAQRQLAVRLHGSDEATLMDGTVVKYGGGMASMGQGQVANPLYGGNPFEPSSYVQAVPSDPALAQPLPSGRYIDPAIPSQLNSARMADIEEYRKYPKKYMEDHGTELTQEQSIMDKGASMLARVFDYRDEADLSLFGMNLSAVESVFDNSVRYLTGFYDVVNVGLGGLISAMPGGVRTLSGEELSGGKDFLQVLSGEMEPGTAPSPGQIAIASVAAESKRIREGGARLSDVLLLNPATAPFIMAGVAAETSALQQDTPIETILLNNEMRERAFGEGWEKWMSGVTDTGLMFADPLIGAGVALKVTRAGALGARQSLKNATHFQTMSQRGVDEIIANQGGAPGAGVWDEIAERALAREQARKQTSNPLERLLGGEDIQPLYEPRRVTNAAPMPNYKNPLAIVYHRIAEFDEVTGQKVMSIDDIMGLPEIKALDDKATFADLLYRAEDPLQVSVIVEASMGAPRAMQRLMVMAPALGDEVTRMNLERVAWMRQNEPQKVTEAAEYFSKAKENLEVELGNVDDLIGRRVEGMKGSYAVDELGQPIDPELSALYQRKAVLQQSFDEASYLERVIKGDETIDLLDSRSPFYDPVTADRVMEDLLSRRDWVTKALNSDIQDAARSARMQFASAENWYARAVERSRFRRGEAAGAYAEEGTSVFIPKKRVTEVTEAGEIKGQLDWMPANLLRELKDGWSAREFGDGLKGFRNEIRRQARVWRWMGSETPSGYIGLKGTSTVNSEREFAAALDLDLYKGDGVKITRADGQTVVVGGREARRRYTEMFIGALNDPAKDPLEALKEIERRVGDDFAEVYFPSVLNTEGKKLVQEAISKGDRLRDKTLTELRQRGYFVDPDTGSIQYAPYLKSQLANGTYMQNWHEMEKALRRLQRREHHQRLGDAASVAADYTLMADNLFQTFWRPLTLMRASYTQRNVFEGMIRSMAYQASLAPLTWPVRGTFRGIQAKAGQRAAARGYKKAVKAIEGSPEFRPLWDEFSDAAIARHDLATAFRFTDVGDAEEMMHFVRKMPDGSSVRRKMSLDDYDEAVKAADARLADAEASMRASEDVFAKTIEGTKFGDWRSREISDLQKTLVEMERHQQIALDLISEPDAYGRMFSLGDNPVIVERLAEMRMLSEVVTRQLDDLRYRPMYAAQMYRNHAARQRRIGSGTSIGPDGGYYADAFMGPFEQLNRGLMSADNTTKQQLSMIGDLYGNLFQRILVRQNRAIPFNPAEPRPWADGMASFIEDASSNDLVIQLVRNGFDVDETLIWLKTTPEGQRYADGLKKLFDSDSIDPVTLSKRPDAEDAAAAIDDKVYTMQQGVGPEGDTVKNWRIKRFISEGTDLDGNPLDVYDLEQASLYLRDVAQKVQDGLQGIPDFMDVLSRRVQAKAAGKADVGVDYNEILAIINRLTPEQKASLKFIQGSQIIQMGSNSFMDLWTKFTNKMFKALGTIPEDAIVRGPFYNQRFKDVRNDLISQFWLRQGTSAADVKKARKEIRKASGQKQGRTITHDEFRIPAREMAAIEVKAHRAALRDTKEWLYTIDRRTKLGKYGETIFPFISASQNSTVAAGKLLWKEPWLAPMIADLWRAPQKLGIEDEDGNLTLPMPLPVVEFLKDNPNVPFLGGVVMDGDTITIPKDGLNVFMPDTGFGVLPRPTPLVQVAASELMKAGAFPVETPAIFKAVWPNGEDSDKAYQLVKDYIFGEQSSMSAEFLSWDKVTPAWTQRLIEMKKELGSEYGYEYALQWNTQNMRWKGGERDDKPTPEEIHKRVTNGFWFKFFGNLGLPTPLTPYPILTRPNVERTAVEVMMEEYQKIKGANPVTGNMDFYNMFGDWALEASLTKVSRNVGGADATAQAVSDIKTFDPLIRQAAGVLTEGNYDILGILVNNRSREMDYDPNAYAWQKSATIPGTNRPFREVQSPEEAIAERQRIVGWTTYRKAMDQLDAMLASRGLASYESTAAADLKDAKNTMIANLANNPDMAGWWVDYQDVGGTRTESAVRVMELAVQDEKFRKEMYSAGKDRLLNAMDQYLYFRRGVIQQVDASGAGLTDDQNRMIRDGWLTIRQELKNSDDRFAEIFDMYLSSDENPKFPGNYIVDPAYMALVRGEVVGNR